MGRCLICGKEADKSAVIYQADLIGSQTATNRSGNMFGDTTSTTVTKTYKNVASGNYFCCKECRRVKGLWLIELVVSLVLLGLMWLCFETIEVKGFWTGLLITVTTLFGVFGGLPLFFRAIYHLIYPYESVASAVLSHLNKSKNSTSRVYMTQNEAAKLRRA